MQTMSAEIHNLQGQLRLLAAEMAQSNARLTTAVDQTPNSLPLVGSLPSLFSDAHIHETLRQALSEPGSAAEWARSMTPRVEYAEDISIVMPAYNHEKTVAEAIESVLRQDTQYTYTIYCIDDASTDNTGKILTGFAKTHPEKIKVFTNPKNLGSGRRSIYNQKPPVRGRFWCLLAGDDYWISNEKIQSQVDFLVSNLEYTGCCGNTLVHNEITNQDSYIQPDVSDWNLLDLLIHRNKYALYAHPSSITWRNVYLENGFFLPPAFENSSQGGDVLLYHLMLSGGGKMHLIPAVASCYRITGQGIWTSKSSQEQAALNGALIETLQTLFNRQFTSLLNFQLFKNLIPSPVNS